MTEMSSTTTATNTIKAIRSGRRCAVMEGDSMQLVRSMPDSFVDLTVTSPPYCMGKEYERSTSVDDFIEAHKTLLPEVVRATRDGGSICWQIGYHVRKQEVFPLDFAVFEIMRQIEGVHLRNRIIWTYAHGLHGRDRFSGRHEVVLWFTKGPIATFDLDAVRVPQKYPGKRHYKGPKKGEYSGNPLGKNPGDVWEIPNVKGNHVEKSEHPCQFPVALVQRLVRSLTKKGDVVFDPFLGSGSSGVAALIEERRFIGAELDPAYVAIARDRLRRAIDGTAKIRPVDQPIFVPRPGMAVARAPDHFHREV